MNGILRKWKEHSVCSGDVTKRVHAIEALSGSDDPDAVQLLVERLGDVEPAVRGCAAAALGKHDDPEVIRQLVALVLLERHHEVLDQAFTSLKMLDSDEAILAMLHALDEKDVGVCQAAARALRRVAWDRLDDATRARIEIIEDNWQQAVGYGSSAIESLTHALFHGTQISKRRAAEAFGRIGTDPCLSTLVKAMRSKDQDPTLHEIAAWGIRRVFWKKADDADLATAAVALQDWSGAREFGRFAVEPLVAALYAKDTSARQGAVETLDSIATEEAFAALVKTLCDPHQDVAVREQVASLLAHSDDRPSRDALVAALADDSWPVRVAAGNALGHRGWKPESDVEQCLYQISKKNWPMLRVMGSVAIGPLTHALRYHQVREEAVKALINFGPCGRDALALILQEHKQTPSVLEVACMALADDGDPRAIDLVKAMLDDQDSAMQQFAVWTLERLGWTPGTLRDVALAAIAHGNWETVTNQGEAAVDPLLRMITEVTSPDEALESLEQILKSAPGRIAEDHLHTMAQFKEAAPMTTILGLDQDTSDLPFNRTACRTNLRRMAKHELFERGIGS